MDGVIGYLANVEASAVGVRAGPGVVYIRLKREIAAEGSRRVPSMFVEMTPGEALETIAALQRAVGTALAFPVDRHS